MAMRHPDQIVEGEDWDLPSPEDMGSEPTGLEIGYGVHRTEKLADAEIRRFYYPRMLHYPTVPGTDTLTVLETRPEQSDGFRQAHDIRLTSSERADLAQLTAKIVARWYDSKDRFMSPPDPYIEKVGQEMRGNRQI